ncbi:hypothetical protein [Paenibacillus sp. Marseille-Q4541]|uniref:hypothetical protein n=1 Tax=Paenibacillus sp. Marseille-Q4541 TaxID=2831522 RepID=UPI001BA6C1DE|nr:hypothetical protein [Paenibacillus sp. Marseille-Q4541]
MNLADLLTYADIGQLNRIANHYECNSNTHSKHELIQNILITLGSSSFVEEQIRDLPEGQLSFLNALLFDGRSNYSIEELTALAKQAIEPKGERPASYFRDIVVQFTKRGWLFNGSTQQTRYLYRVPKDLKTKFMGVIQSKFTELVEVVPEPPVYREEHHLIAEDIRLLLEFTDQYEIPLNQEGFMYKRTQQQLMEFLHVKEQLVGKAGWRFGYGRSYKEYPDRLALLYDYAIHQRYLSESGGMLTVTDEGTLSFEKSSEEELIQIFRYWLRLYKGAIPSLSSIVYWIGECAQEWVTVSSLLESMGEMIHPFYYDTNEAVLKQRILQMMMHLGMVRIGEHPEKGQVVRMTPWGKKLTVTCNAVQYTSR